MKRIILIIAVICACLIGQANAAETNRFEYATIRWAGRDNTHVIRPNGKVEFVGPEIQKFKKPDRADDRAFYMNLVVNALARDGYEVVAMSGDDIIMKRIVTPH
jgi:hypothetical protein